MNSKSYDIIIVTGPQYQGQQGYNQYGAPDQYGPPQQQYQQPPAQFPPPNRYPPYGDGNEGYVEMFEKRKNQNNRCDITKFFF